MRGFTLIEVMIAVAILAIISFLLWQTSAVSLNAKIRYEEEDIRFHEVLMALTRIADDISMAYLYQSEEHLGKSGRGELQRQIQFYGKDNGDQDDIHFASMAHIRYLKDSHESEEAEIAYQLVRSEDPDQGWRLMRRHQSPPDAEPLEGGASFVVLDGVQRLDFQYYDRDNDEWRRSWDSQSLETNNKLPRGVEITLTIPDPTNPEETRSFTTTTVVEMAPGPNDF